MAHKLSEFKEFDLLAGLPDDVLVCELQGQERVYEADTILWQEGDPAQEFIFVLEGTIEIFRFINGQRLHINTIEQGQTGGELPLLQGTPHPGNGKALTKVRTYALNENYFWQLMGYHPIIRQRVLAIWQSATCSFGQCLYSAKNSCH